MEFKDSIYKPVSMVLRLLVLTGCLCCFCSKDSSGTLEELRIKSVGLPDGYVIKIESSFYPEKVNVLCRNYWSIPALGRALPMNLVLDYTLGDEKNEIKIPLVNTRLPLVRRWPFCRWRLDNINVMVEKKFDQFLNIFIVESIDTVWQRQLDLHVLSPSEYNLILPDTLHWDIKDRFCEKSNNGYRFILNKKKPTLIISKCR
jgi:hypothetical protein